MRTSVVSIWVTAIVGNCVVEHASPKDWQHHSFFPYDHSAIQFSKPASQLYGASVVAIRVATSVVDVEARVSSVLDVEARQSVVRSWLLLASLITPIDWVVVEATVVRSAFAMEFLPFDEDKNSLLVLRLEPVVVDVALCALFVPFGLAALDVSDVVASMPSFSTGLDSITTFVVDLFDAALVDDVSLVKFAASVVVFTALEFSTCEEFAESRAASTSLQPRRS